MSSVNPSARSDEFPPGASEWSDALSRRDFLQLMGASFALAGVSGCARRAPKELVPAVTPPEFAGATPGEIQWYASAMPLEGYGRGILVRANSGRPTKIEGNPSHPESLGATDVFTQAAILSLYDPDRSRAPLHRADAATWNAFEDAWAGRHRAFASSRGRGLALLTEPTTSPTLLRTLHELLAALPEARWFQHAPLGRYDHDGTQDDIDFAQAEVVFAVQSDCFYHHPAAVRYGRAWADRRRVNNGRVHPPRLYAIEPTPSVTGALADVRLPASPARQRRVLAALAAALGGTSILTADLTAAETEFVRSLAADVRAHPGHAVCIAGPEAEPTVQTWAAAFNARSGTAAVHRRATVRSDADPRAAGDLAALTAAMTRGEVQGLFVLETNPVYTAPADLAFADAFRRVEFTVHLGEHVDETAALAQWHLPAANFLETWGDLRGYDGTPCLQQPLLEPLYPSRSSPELVHFIASATTRNAYDLVRATWRHAPEAPSDDHAFELRWAHWLERGVIDDTSGNPAGSPALAAASADAASSSFPSFNRSAHDDHDTITIVLQPDPNLLDGRYANSSWLQELPKPLTHIVWDNAALVSATFAGRHRLNFGDVILCEVDGASVAAPVWIAPGHADGVIALALGYGRTSGGATAPGHGYDAFRLRTTRAPWERTGATLRKLGEQHALVCTQGHFSMEGRDLVRVVAPAEAARAIEDKAPQPTMLPAWNYTGYAWGMSIDLGTCLGCNACIIACQAENNIAVVGKDQVSRGREMHWLRIDRYYDGDAANPRILHQPVPCMQCENAPCEVVCPVAATVHSSEGLNDMVYNRCVGTRYCSNNCPYKVRRFNFLDYRQPRDSTLYLQANPNVTVRERGVMEKCTYCVQRINTARITAEKESRRIRDGEIRTACQQACPADAIVFGDIHDPASRVVQRKAEPIDYTLLRELNTRPRTTYLARVINAPTPAAPAGVSSAG
ncbi:Fe-S-cluster-containing hydrogenase [Horticoccus luteus]|uniref:Fe-S-cluster-containing hydrogenase n=1 Tax=Horticoccus luteus TaxID=2862869 RepID=A0A8F9TVL7_9BACT|nr:Fe-S-cluster-containing hydrogenase [Horticoccus luteus]QYM78801.1 Fe-S-cluster-containing hydrogenase [Horticoccus luteus]